MRATGWLLALTFSAIAQTAFCADAYRGADPVLLQQLRDRFASATTSGKALSELIKLLDEKLPGDPAAWPPVFSAYRAALEGLVGKHSLAPWRKYNHAKAGLARFQGLVEAHPDSIEIRMLRYSTCSQLPDFFQMQPQAEADLQILTEQFAQGVDPMVPDPLRQGYLRWILDNGKPSPDVRKQLEAALAAAD